MIAFDQLQEGLFRIIKLINGQTELDVIAVSNLWNPAGCVQDFPITEM